MRMVAGDDDDGLCCGSLRSEGAALFKARHFQKIQYSKELVHWREDFRRYFPAILALSSRHFATFLPAILATFPPRSKDIFCKILLVSPRAPCLLHSCFVITSQQHTLRSSWQW
jgi:hypothetical protein